MKWLCPLLLFHIIAIEKVHSQHIEFANNKHDLVITGEYKKGAYFKVPSYSPWSGWGACRNGRRVRKRHCLRHQICGNALRIEVASCRRHAPRMKILARGKIDNHHDMYDQNHGLKMSYQTKQLDSNDVQRKFRGFSPWSAWSSCSRRCTTVRRRYCQRSMFCGRKVIKQSAYCYVEGSYCQHWIRTRMQRRKDPGYGYKVIESMSPPVPVIHKEDSRIMPPAPVECGRIGRYRGSASGRMKSRMRDMVRIIGGRPAPPGKWPWQVVVLNRYKEAFCGGTIVSLRWVVTAAHCVRKKLYVRLGEHDLLIRGPRELEMRVTEAVIHPRYDPDTVVNDVAMLRLPSPARPDLGHGIACLPRPHQILPPHTSCVILGWGKKRPTDVHGTRLLHEAQVSTIQQGVCRRSYWQYAITDNMVCAGRGRRDSCAGDSGGPLLCRDHDMRYYLQGITSFGDGCGKRGKYGIYTRTAGYVSWMKEIMNNKYFD
ncbi:hypothetical protein evm_008264 [Chilo suppressalis]|nr:hypothetical protein evm_008264 [Chilo suppressalis]